MRATKKQRPKGFSSVKPYAHRVRKHPFINLLRRIAKRVFPKSEIIYSEPLPENEGIILCCNHALDYGPLVILTDYKRPMRLWSDPALCYFSKVPNHAMLYFFPETKGIVRFFARIASFLLTIVVPVFRGLEVIPAYRNPDVLITFRKTAETIAENKDVIIFPETEVPSTEYKYVNNLNNGFIRVSRFCSEKTGTPVKFYPAYACKSLRKLLIGHPVVVDTERSEKEQLKEFKKKISDEIESLANSLPPHEITPFNFRQDDPSQLKKYGANDKYSYKKLRKNFNAKNEIENSDSRKN
ncbi:MAG: hypothetical protein LBU04_07025 [Christensenellaceae bacterium]|jgi:hypothetical protein|nr:hypothetical protein [Christensenellaceae bacterium]